jgi:Cu/Ag efflux protein CusF
MLPLVSALPLAVVLSHAPSPRVELRDHARNRESRATATATASGRVKRVDRRREEVVIEVAGRDEVYGVDDIRILDALREGDRVQFEYEERQGGRKVIVRVF